MTTTAQQVPSALSTEGTDELHGVPRALIVALIVLAAFTMALAVWQLMVSNTSAPVSHAPQAAADPWAAARPGGSVYQQQVPQAAADQMAPYRPGGSVYQQQVPQAAADQMAPYRPGGSVYQQQVPEAAR